MSIGIQHRVELYVHRWAVKVLCVLNRRKLLLIDLTKIPALFAEKISKSSQQ